MSNVNDEPFFSPPQRTLGLMLISILGELSVNQTDRSFYLVFTQICRGVALMCLHTAPTTSTKKVGRLVCCLKDKVQGRNGVHKSAFKAAVRHNQWSGSDLSSPYDSLPDIRHPNLSLKTKNRQSLSDITHTFPKTPL